jgi:hypothetical protein
MSILRWMATGKEKVPERQDAHEHQNHAPFTMLKQAIEQRPCNLWTRGSNRPPV